MASPSYSTAPTPPATTTTPGKIQLSGDLGGTAALPYVKNRAFSCQISKDESTGIMTAILADGSRYTHSTDFLALFNTVMGVIPEPCTIQILPSVTPYLCGAATGTGTITKDCTIYGYGASLLANTSHTGGEMLKVTVNQKTLRVFGLSVDVNKMFGNAIGGGSTTLYAPKLVQVKDCTITNIYSYGIRVTDQVHDATSTLIVDDTYVDAGSSNSANECIETNSVTNIVIRNVKTRGNKPTYCSGDNILLDTFQADCTGFTGTVDVHLQCSRITVRNISLTQSLLLLRPYGDTETNTPTVSAKYMIVDGVYSNNTTVQAMRIDTYNDTNGSIDQIRLRNINITRGEISIDTYRNSYTNLHGKIGTLDISDLSIGAFSGNKACLIIRNNDIGILQLGNVNAPSALSTDSSASLLRAEVNLSSITLGQVDITTVNPLPPNNLLKVTDSNSGNALTIKFVQSLYNGASGVITTGTPVVNKTILMPPNLYAQGNVTGATTFNVSTGAAITATLVGNIIITLTPAVALGTRMTLIISQDSTGGRTVTWPSNFRKNTGVLEQYTIANNTFVVKMIWDGTNWLEMSRMMELI